MISFSQLNLDTRLSKAISASGYTEPTPIQARAIPEILKGRDLIGSAQTGTGKTAAFVLPTLHRLTLTKGTQKPRVLILTPTRELATQVTLEVNKYGKFLNFRTASLVGGMSYYRQIQDLRTSLDIIVATPGRLLDHLAEKRVDLSQIEILILDEADRMLDMGFIDDVQTIARATPQNRQTLLFSATVDNKIGRIVKNLLKDPVYVDMSEQLTAKNITQELYKVDDHQHKMRLFKHFLTDKNLFKAIIFTATKINCDKLADNMRKDGFSAAAIHGDLKQSARNRVIEQMRRGKIQYLVATDVAARGINITDITHVINYDIPKFPEDYVHRIGRTARAGKSGIAITFALPTEGKHLQKIERHIKQTFSVHSVPGMQPTKGFENATPASRKKGPPRKHAARPFKGRSQSSGNGPHSRGGQGPQSRSQGPQNRGKASPSRSYR